MDEFDFSGWTVADLRKFADNAETACRGLNAHPAETPFWIGFLATTEPPQRVVDRGRELAERFGW